MKKIFLFALGVVMASCINVEPQPTFLTLDFEGEQWDDFHTGVATDPYSSNVVANGYSWQAAGSSLSSHAVVDEYGIIRGGMILSSYNSNDIATYGDYSKDLYVYNSSPKSTTTGGGYAGSDNFLVVVGDYNDMASDKVYAEMYFADGYARQIQGCHVNSTTYFLNVAQNGNPSIAAPLGDDDEIIISATGYDSSGAETATVKMTLARKGQYIKQWTSWDLHDLGKVVKVRFNVEGGPMTEWGMTTPKYFAIDNLVVEDFSIPRE